ncbi:MAG: DUF503 domain-containing protein [Gemmatimonadetes bacterium]|nr:DUF503 domain-containing protein [Gemmatimonadota bacterium]
MIVGVVSWQLSLPGCMSLKDKRRVVKSLKDRIHHHFKVSVAETGQQDVWTRSEITVAVVATDTRNADQILDRIDRMIEDEGRALILGRRRDLH